MQNTVCSIIIVSMNKSDLVQIIADRQYVSLSNASLAVNAILGAIAKTIAEHGRVEIRGFGVFNLAYRNPRKGRNPATGETVEVPGKFAPRFKPGKDLAERVNASLGD